MEKINKKNWIPMNPDFGRFRLAQNIFLDYARELQRWLHKNQSTQALLLIRADFLEHEENIRREIWPTLKAAGLVLTDLVEQCWDVRIRSGSVQVLPPKFESTDPVYERELIRKQELIKRNVQLLSPSVQKFISSMERKRLFEDQFVSIFSLMRDGRELAKDLKYAAKHANNGNGHSLFDAVKPYLEFVDYKKRCKFTGLRLMDIWRYFRHTWTNQYTSVPGRTMMVLVRDAAAPFHPVIGIAGLSSPIIQLSERDKWIGWHPESFIEYIKQHPTKKLASWLISIVDEAISEIYINDFLKEQYFSRRELKKPNNSLIEALKEEGASQREAHHRYTDKGQYEQLKKAKSSVKNIWKIKAETHLFRSKRALALADLLQARMVLNEYIGKKPTAEKLYKLTQSSIGKKTIGKIIRKAKADKVGIAMADISVCGAIAPYNEILGGKLVSMLMTSPEVVNEYKRRYKNTSSEIASSMAGKPIKRPANLVYLGTTSLYGSNSSQYNRIRIPLEHISENSNNQIRYIRLGKSEAFGTSHYSNDTIDALVRLVNHRKNGQRVNSIFGEGASPKLRKVREGLETLGITSEIFLKHGRQRIIYGIPLVNNLKEYLLQIHKHPKYLISLKTSNATNKICEWWMVRWLKMRIQNRQVINSVSKHTLIEPVNHGARVSINKVAINKKNNTANKLTIENYL